MSPDTLALRLFVSLLPALAMTACHSGTDPNTDSDTGFPVLHDATGCMAVDPGTEDCPPADAVSLASLQGGCGSTTLKINGEGYLNNFNPNMPDTGGDDLYCCYPIRETEPDCDYGRPYLEQGQPRLAPPIREDRGWVDALDPVLQGLSAADRAALAARWTVAAQDEHAAVAAFARVALDLMAAGAPADLVDDTFAAGRDEVRHARLGFGLASAYAGQTVAPGAFPFREPVVPETDLVAIAVATAREGCVGETVATLLALEAASVATDPAARQVLASIGSDETRHSLLAWRTVAWALATGGAPVRAAIAEVFAEVARDGVRVRPRPGDADATVLAAHGVLDDATSEAVAARAVARVILPMARRLLATPIATAESELRV